jgi:hypothetical protein
MLILSISLCTKNIYIQRNIKLQIIFQTTSKKYFCFISPYISRSSSRAVFFGSGRTVVIANMAKIICLSCFNELSRYDKIFSCSRKHNFCAPCGKSMHLQCEVCLRIFLCSLIFLLRIPKTKFDYGRACIESIKLEVKFFILLPTLREKNLQFSL